MGSVADCHQGATNNKAADDGDSINSKQQPAHNAAFSFGHRPLIAPDLSCTENWEMVGALLALCGT
jgi:hypothetical protein